MLLAAAVFLAVLVGAVSAQSHAAPNLPHPTAHAAINKLVPIKTVITPSGPLVYYGRQDGTNATDLSPATNATASTQKRCGTNLVLCDGRHTPKANPCWTLIYGGLQRDTSVVPTGAYGLCLTAGSQCCISWSAPVPGLQARWLFNAAADVYRGCVVNGMSGASCDTNLNGVCLMQCLADRAEGCEG